MHHNKSMQSSDIHSDLYAMLCLLTNFTRGPEYSKNQMRMVSILISDSFEF